MPPISRIFDSTVIRSISLSINSFSIMGCEPDVNKGAERIPDFGSPDRRMSRFHVVATPGRSSAKKVFNADLSAHAPDVGEYLFRAGDLYSLVVRKSNLKLEEQQAVLLVQYIRGCKQASNTDAAPNPEMRMIGT